MAERNEAVRVFIRPRRMAVDTWTMIPPGEQLPAKRVRCDTHAQAREAAFAAKLERYLISGIPAPRRGKLREAMLQRAK